MKIDYKQNGSITELLVIAKLMEYGVVSIPYGNNARYDCIFDFNNKLIRIQIKTSRKLSEDCFSIPLRNKRLCAKGSVSKPYTKDTVDFIATIFNNKVYLIPAPEFPKNSLQLRLCYPKNGIKKTINLASDYELDVILNNLLNNNDNN